MNSYQLLRDKLGFSTDLPYTADWSAAEDFLILIADYCLDTRPSTIVECSSGLSTLILTRCCQLNNHGKVYSLENGAEYALKTRQQLKDFNLQDYASVLDAPLEEKHINNKDYLWYTDKSLPAETIDMLVIDGPPGFIQQHSRYPALPMLYKKFSTTVKIFLDDAERKDEKEIINLWKSEYTDIEHEYIKNERGCSVLTINN